MDKLSLVIGKSSDQNCQPFGLDKAFHDRYQAK